MQTLNLSDALKTVHYIGLLLFMGGCGNLPTKPTAIWVHPINSSVDIEFDHISCAYDVWAKYAKKPGWISAGDAHFESATDATASCTTYKNNTSCVFTPATPKRYVPSTRIEGDQNAEPRNRAYAECMLAFDPQYSCPGGTYMYDCGAFPRERYAPTRWEKLDTIELEGERATNYFSPQSIRKVGEDMAIVMMTSRARVGADGTGSGSSKWLFNCQRREMRLLLHIEYSQTMAQGKQTNSKKYVDEGMGQIPAETTPETLYKIACGK